MFEHLRRHGWRYAIWTMTIGVVIFYLRQLWENRLGQFVPPPRPTTPSREQLHLPHVTIVVPARNEQRNIRRCVLSLLAQTYPYYDVVVVNDNSTDGTGTILEEIKRGPGGERLTIIAGRELPLGWAGKPHALAQGVEHAKGEWILFTDADTMHRPGALAWAVEHALDHDADLVSALAYIEMVDPGNHIIMPIVVMGITAQYPPRMVADPRFAVAIANGQFILIRRTMYDATGGYAGPALRASVVDDRDLAAVVKARRGHIVLLDGRDQVSVCMYRNLAEAWRGWSKNAYVGSKGGPILFVLMAIGLPIGTVLPYLLSLIGLFSKKREIALAGALQLAAITAYRWLADDQARHSRLWGLTHPIGGAIITGLLWQVAWRQFTGKGVEWSGRVYKVRQREPVGAK